MAKQSNPAGRIYEILRHAKRKSPKAMVKEVWADVLGADPAKVHSLFVRLVRLEEAFEEAERNISSLDVNHGLYLKHFPALRSAIAPTNFEHPWEISRNLLTEDALTSLEFCADLLDQKLPEKDVPEDDLERLTSEVNELLESILASEMANSAKQILADIARSMQDALTEYRIRGVRGMREELFAIVARLERNYPTVSSERERPEVARFFEVLSRWDAVTSLCLNAAQVGTSLLPPLLQMAARG